MKFSEQWLREWVDPNISTQDLVSRLTMAGLEVDGVESAAARFSGVLVGEITAVEAHPEADKLRICTVSGHPDGVKQVVCGAPNARVGIKVPFATIGALLPGDFKIKRAKLRGVESFGMLCAQTELELGEESDGLWELPSDAPVGADLRDWLKLDDKLIDVDLTPNRSDCLSLRGLAREVAVLSDQNFADLAIEGNPCTHSEQLDIQIDAPEACPVYTGRIIRNVDVSRPTPLWLKEKLRRSDIRSIDPVVDVTNYILLELGQPMHAFDLGELSGGICVRWARTNEALALLNDQTVELRDDTLVIADERNALAIAGVMGGRSSAVSSETKDIFLESAFFAPRHVAGVARSYGLHTDSSHRFERGVDFELSERALERATQLLLQIVGGEVGPVSRCEMTDHLPVRKPIHLNRQNIRRRLSIDPDTLDVESMMRGLGLLLVEENDRGWIFSVPSHRFDLDIEEDLLEEVARIYGYDRIPSCPVEFFTELESHSESKSSPLRLKQILCDRGYQEIITYSFIDPKVHEALFARTPAILLRNPISADMALMRTSLLPGLISSLSGNLKRQQSRAKLFELGMVFLPQQSVGETVQINRIGGVTFGPVRDASWAESVRDGDFFDIKGDLEAALKVVVRGHEVRFQPLKDEPFLHPGQSARVLIDGQSVGFVGALHPNTAKAFGISKPVWVFECDLVPLTEASIPHARPLSRFPGVTRDIAVLIDKGVCVADLESSIQKVAGATLKELKLFDVYSGEGIDPKEKSLAFSLTFQHRDRTLTDEEVNASMAHVLHCLQEHHGATLR